jgi:hypothetical protein
MNNSRRKFLKNAGSAAGGAVLAAHLPPVEKLVQLILRDTLSKAHADSGTSKYIYVDLYGAPPRWVFDQFLESKTGQSIDPSPMAATNYVSSAGSVTGTEYRTTPYKGVPVGPIWNTQVATSSGTAPLSNLLDNMIVIRGYGSGIDGHPSNSVRQTRPLPGLGSVTGYVADSSSTLFKAIQFPAAGVVGTISGFASILGTGETVLYPQPNHPNYVDQLLSAFGSRAETAPINALRDQYSALINSAQNVLSTAEQSDHPDFGPVAVDQRAAIQKIKDGVSGLDADWNSLYTKYLNIANASFFGTAPGFNDNQITVPADVGYTGNDNADSPWTVHADIGRLWPTAGQDVRNWVNPNTLDLSSWAATFALAEYVVVHNYVSAYELYVAQPAPVTFAINHPAGVNSPYSTPLLFDQHFMGLMPGLFLTACTFRALGACLLELVNVLKAKGLFSNTVIHMAGEFGRLPRNTKGGSDHAFDGMVSSILTGLQTTGPLVLGNILYQFSPTDPLYQAGYTGTFGYKAPTTVAGQSGILLTPVHVASTLASLLKLPVNPWINFAAPLVTVGANSVSAQCSAEVVQT